MFKKNSKGKEKATAPSVSEATSLETEKLQKQAAGKTKTLFGLMLSK
jgi:hypothetical protein